MSFSGYDAGPEPSTAMSDDGRTPNISRLEFMMTHVSGELTNMSQVEFRGRRINPVTLDSQHTRDSEESAADVERNDGIDLISEAARAFLETDVQKALLIEASSSRASSVTLSLLELAEHNRDLLELVTSRPEVALPILDAQATQLAKEHLLRSLINEWMREVEGVSVPPTGVTIGSGVISVGGNGRPDEFVLSDLPEDAQSLVLKEVSTIPQITVRIEGFSEINSYQVVPHDNGMSSIVLSDITTSEGKSSSSLRVLESPFLLGRVVYLEGIITKVSPVVPEVKHICFVCRSTETRATLRLPKETARIKRDEGLEHVEGDVITDEDNEPPGDNEVMEDFNTSIKAQNTAQKTTSFCGATVWSDTTTNTMTISPNPPGAQGLASSNSVTNKNVAAVISAAAGHANNNNTPLILIPLVCPVCRRRGTMVPDYTRSVYEDTQVLVMQDDIATSTDTVRDEATNSSDTTNTMPAVQRLFIHGGNDSRYSLIDYVTPGDRVRVTGVYRCRPKKGATSGSGSGFTGGNSGGNTVIDVSNNTSSINQSNAIRAPGGNILKSVFGTFIDVIAISKVKRTKKDVDAMDMRMARTGEIIDGAAGGDNGDGDGDSMVHQGEANSSGSSVAQALGRGIGANTATTTAGRASVPDPSMSTLLSAELLIERQVVALASDPDIVKRLIASIAPSIHGMESVKTGLLCQLVGGVEKGLESGISNMNEGYSPSTTSTNGFSTRGSIHILLCGDPGTAKSQLLSFIHSTAPRSVYTSGKGASSAGLTAYVTKGSGGNDESEAAFSLSPGALLLSSPNGILCLDELDKLPQESQLSLHEAMESQRVSIAKAGIVCSLQCTASVLAAANPVKSRWDRRRKIGENIGMNAGLISRFDLVFVVLDAQTPEEDAELARHVVGMFYDDGVPRGDTDIDMDTLQHNIGQPGAISNMMKVIEKTRHQPTISPQLLARYIARAKTLRPVLTGPAKKQLLREYLSMRTLNQVDAAVTGYAKNRNLTITPRHLESLIRLAEAFAKLRLSLNVMLRDVICATELMKNAIKNGMLDSPQQAQPTF